MKVFGVFPYPVLASDEYPVSPAEVEAITNQQWNNNSGGGDNRISVSSYVLELPALQGLKAFLQAQIDRYAYEMLRIKRSSVFYITQSWVNFNLKGTKHHEHFHPNSLISGVFYLDGGQCPLLIRRPHTHLLFGNIFLEYEQPSEWTQEYVLLPNRRNTAILFPSVVHHAVTPNESEAPRVSLAFNSFVRGHVGSGPALTELNI